MPSTNRQESSLQASESQESVPLLTSGSDNWTGRADFVKIAATIGFLTSLSGLEGEFTIVAAIGPTIGKEFNNESLSLFLGTTFLLFSTVSTLIAARISDIFGRRLTTTVSCGIYATGSLICATASSIGGILVGRAIAGFGLGGIAVMVSVVLSETVPLRSRALWHSIGKLVAGIAMSAGGPIGGWISDNYTWQTAFYVQVPLGVISAAMASYAIPGKMAIHQSPTLSDPKQQPLMLDLFQYILLIFSLVPILLCLSGGTSILALSRAARLALGTVGFLSFIGLWYRSATTKNPLVSLRHFRSRVTASILAINLISSLVHQSILYNIPLFAVTVSQASAATAGAYIMPVSMAAVLATLVAGLRIAKNGRYKHIMSIGVAFVTMGPLAFICVSFLPQNAPFHTTLEVLSSFPSTFGAQLLNAVSIVALLASCEPNDIAELTSHVTLSKSLGGVIGTALSAIVLEHFHSACRAHKLQDGGNHNIVTVTESLYGRWTNGSMELHKAELSCWKNGFEGMFAVLASISTINIVVICFGIDGSPLV